MLKCHHACPGAIETLEPLVDPATDDPILGRRSTAIRLARTRRRRTPSPGKMRTTPPRRSARRPSCAPVSALVTDRNGGRTTPRTSHKCVPSPLPRGRNVRFGAPPPRSPRSNDTTWETGGRRYPGRATDQAEEETELSRHEEGPRRHDAALAHARLRVVSRPWQIPHPDRRPNRGRRCSAAPCGGRRDPPLLAPRDAGRHLSTCHTPQRTRLLRIVKPSGHRQPRKPSNRNDHRPSPGLGARVRHGMPDASFG